VLRKLDFAGNPYLGVFCASNEELTVLSPGIAPGEARRLEEALETVVVRTTLGGSTVVGALMAVNAHGAVVTDFVEDEERKVLGDLSLLAMPHRLNAAGNNILCNDRGALVHPGYDRGTVKLLADVLDVEVARGTVAGVKTVGSAAVATNRGVLCHPHTTEAEMRRLEEVLKVPAVITTANYGTAQVGACMVANTKGCVVGTRTTAIELGRIEEGLGLY
jgi:translation initiation factor 6